METEGMRYAALVMVLLAGARAEIAPPGSYLAGVVAELEKTYPAHRTVTIVFHGHSVPAGYFQTPEVRSLEAYPNLVRMELARRFPHAVFNVIVTAKGGESSTSGAARFERDVLGCRPDVVFLDYALNDRRVGLEAARAAWSAMIRQSLEAKAKVILLTPTADLKADPRRPEDPLAKHAAQVRSLAAEFETGLVDSLAIFQQQPDVTGLMSQFNHPNEAGHRLVADEILKYFPRGRH
jgi:lysophospholipase L1-like esterase